MFGKITQKDYADINYSNRIGDFPKAAIAAAIAEIGQIGYFVCENVMNTPKPISMEFLGYSREQIPMGDYNEVYSYEYSSPGYHALNILGFIFGLFAAVAVVFVFYCIARYIANPIMYKIAM